jgi:transcription initiation factor TFIIIB Brf1 subunit/transcription initiation factor TFIIB
MNHTDHCKLIPFPSDRRIGKARKAAKKIRERRGSQPLKEAYWRQTVSTLIRQLEKLGLDRTHIEKEIDAFTAAVRAEIVRMDHAESGQTRGGAA